MKPGHFPRWLAAAVVAEGALACASLALILRQIADLVQGDGIFRFNPTGAIWEVVVNAGIPALLLIALTLVPPLPFAWWRTGSRLMRGRGIAAVVVGSWLLLNLGSGALIGPSSQVSTAAIVTEALGAVMGVVAVVGLVWLGKSRLEVAA